MKANHSKTFISRTMWGFVCLFLFLLVGTEDLYAQSKVYTIVLDAGHGGKDPGNRGNGFYEKKIALNIALEVGKDLKKHKDINVIFTRDKDVFVPLDQRAAIANKSNADLFISIHCDAHNSNASGASTFALGLHENNRNFEIAKRENEVILLEDNYEERYQDYDPKNPIAVFGILDMQEEYLDQSLELASYIQTNFSQDLKRKNRNVKQAGFLVLRNTAMPSVLVETGFLTNKPEGSYLNSKKGQKEMSNAISKAVLKYVSHLKQNEIKPAGSFIAREVQASEAVFKVQIASSKKKIETKSYNFKGLKEVDRVYVKPYYKYYLGETSSYDHAKDYLKKAKKAGYDSAFIAAFKDGEKISVKEALKP